MKLKSNFLFVLAILSVAMFSACSDDDNDSIHKTGSEYLSGNIWITTKVTNANGEDVTKTDPMAQNYVGYAYYKPDGVFRIVSLSDAPKMYGKWAVTETDTKRVLDVFNSKNETAYTRTVDITELNDKVFTYKIIPDASTPEKFYIVEHKVDNHKEPLTPAQVLGSTNWKTTKVFDITDRNNPKEMDKTLAPASNYSGNAYYMNKSADAYFPKVGDRFVNGTFKITDYEGKVTRSQGDWYVSLDGKIRTLYAKDESGKDLWNREVVITELTTEKFIYEITQGDITMSVEHEPLK